jgi:hypothetical protein
MTKLSLNRLIYSIYIWSTVFVWTGVIWWLSSIPKLTLVETDAEMAIRVVMQMLEFGFLFLLTYRALLTTFKFRVERLAFWRSKKEESEDMQFVFIVETLLLIIAILLCVIYGGVDEYHQTFVDGRDGSIRDLLLDTIGILVIALVTYSVPVITEIELFTLRKIKGNKKK